MPVEAKDGLRFILTPSDDLDDPFDSVTEWPRLSCPQANQLALEFGNLSIDKSLTVEDAIATNQLSVSDTVTGSLTIENDLTVGNVIATKQLSVIDKVGIGTTNPQAKLDVSGKIKGGGVLAGIWAAQPTTNVMTDSSSWVDVSDTSVTFPLDRDTIICNYSINVQPLGTPRDDYVGTRLVVDDIAYPQSGSHFQPFTSDHPNVNLNGNLVLPLRAGEHTVKLQWKKFVGSGRWESNPSWRYIGGRTLVVMAFYE